MQYKPLFNTLLVEIDDSEAKWGTGNDDSMLGKSYRYGTVVADQHPIFFATKDYPLSPQDVNAITSPLGGRKVMWNEGVEAGTIHEHEGKQYAFIYWFDIRGVELYEQGETEPDVTASNEDVEATKRTLERHGVDPDKVDIVGGGDENGNFTGVR